MRYRVNDACIGCGLCADTCPAVFHMTDDGTAEADSAEVSGEDLPDAEEAKDGCPAEAIEEAE